MRKPTTHCAWLLPALLFFFTHPLLSQNNKATVQLSGTQMRAPLDLPVGRSTVSLCGLTPGNTYLVIAIAMAEGQQATFEIPTSAHSALTGLPGRKNEVYFTAKAACMDIPVVIKSAGRAGREPMYLSVKCESCPDTWKQKFLDHIESAANLTTAAVPSATTLVHNTLISGDCYEVTGIMSSGNAASRGTFNNGQSSIGIQNGVVLCTGNVNVLPGPNDETNADGGFNNTIINDPDLATLTNSLQRDLTVIEFDFKPTASTVQFDFVFGSEEYCEYVGSSFNDVFGFFISGPGIVGKQNLAVLPGGTPITINNINHLTNSSYYINNNHFFFEPCQNLPAQAINDCQLDGWTTTLTATANLQPCQTYHIKLALADVGDDTHSSAVFLRANSFVAGGTVNASPAYAAAQSTAYEGCGQSFIRFTRSGDNSQPQAVSYTVSPASSATPGLDYAPLSGTATIPAGQSEVLVPVNVFSDGLPEGPESIILLVSNSCSCAQSQVNFFIRDKIPLSVALDDVSVCNDSVASLTPMVSDGVAPYSYAWSTGDTTPLIQVYNPPGTATYAVTVTDACGESRSDSALVRFLTSVRVVQDIAFCPGDSVTLGDSTYFETTQVTDTLPGSGSACDTFLVYNLVRLPQPASTDTLTFCSGDSVVIAGVAYFQADTVLEVRAGLNGECDTLLTHILLVSQQVTRQENIAFCPGDGVTLSGQTYTQPGTVTVTLPAQGNGCDTLVTYTLEFLPLPTRAQTVKFCPGDTVTLGGLIYTQAGSVMVTEPATTGTGCDTVVTYTLELLPLPTRAQTVKFCPGDAVTLGGQTYTQPATVVLIEQATAGVGCDTVATYTLEFLPLPTRSQTIEFCVGESVVIGGQTYSQPGQVTITEPATAPVGCDTVVTYTLKFFDPPPANLTLTCPANVEYTLTSGSDVIAVNFPQPTAASDCLCPGIQIGQTSGQASGSTFPIGTNTVCFSAQDSCGDVATCCFQVKVLESPPCDTKTISCIRFDLLSITKDAAGKKTYRIRVTNNCTEALLYTAFQLPSGLTAVKPVNNSIYTAPSGRPYFVRNPNFSPIYSIQFRSGTDAIASGASDVFKYTLPEQASVAYINTVARLKNGAFYEAHLNTFFCPVGTTPPGDLRPEEGEERGVEQEAKGKEPGAIGKGYELRVFPNPTSDVLNADLSSWAGQTVQIRVLDARGQLLAQMPAFAESTAQRVPLTEGLASGLYFLEVMAGNGERAVARFVVE